MGAVQWIDARNEYTEDQALLTKREELHAIQSRLVELGTPNDTVDGLTLAIAEIDEALVQRYIERLCLPEPTENLLINGPEYAEDFDDLINHALEDVREALV